MSQPKDRLIFPLDVPNKAEAERYISLLKDEVGLFKVGLELFVAEGPAFLQFLANTACAELPDLPPTGRAAETVVTDESLFQGAEADYHRQDYGRAYQSYAQYLERYPQGPHAAQARLREAELLGLRGDWRGSLGLYQGILARQPEPEVALKARYGIGRAYFKLGQYQEAAQTLDSLTAVGDLPRSCGSPPRPCWRRSP